jgi:hypothetical protein
MIRLFDGLALVFNCRKLYSFLLKNFTNFPCSRKMLLGKETITFCPIAQFNELCHIEE